MIKSRILRWGDYSRLSRWAQNVITVILKRGRQSHCHCSYIYTHARACAHTHTHKWEDGTKRFEAAGLDDRSDVATIQGMMTVTM